MDPSIPPFRHFPSATSSCINLDYGIWHSMQVLDHFGPLLLALLIHKASKSFFYLDDLGLLG